MPDAGFRALDDVAPEVLGFADEHLGAFLADPAGFARLAAHTCPAAAALARRDLAASGIPALQDSVLRATFLRKFPVTCARIFPDLHAFTSAHLVAALMDAWHEVAVEMLLRYAVQETVETRHLDAVCRNLAAHALEETGGTASGYVPGARETGDREEIDLPAHPSRLHATLRVRRYLAEILTNPVLDIPRRATELAFHDVRLAGGRMEHTLMDEVQQETTVDLRRKIFSDAHTADEHLSSYLKLPRIADGASAVGWVRQTARTVAKSKRRDAINRAKRRVSADAAQDLAAGDTRLAGVSREILHDEFLREQAIADRDSLDADLALDCITSVDSSVDAFESTCELATGTRLRGSVTLILAGAAAYRRMFSPPELAIPAAPAELERVRATIDEHPEEVHRSLKAWHDICRNASTRDQRDIDPALVELWQHYTALEADALLGLGPQVALVLARAAVAVLPTPKPETRAAFIASIEAASTDPAWTKDAPKISAGFVARFCKRTPPAKSTAWDSALRITLDADEAPLGTTSVDVERNLRELFLLSHLASTVETQPLYELFTRA